MSDHGFLPLCSGLELESAPVSRLELESAPVSGLELEPAPVLELEAPVELEAAPVLELEAASAAGQNSGIVPVQFGDA